MSNEERDSAWRRWSHGFPNVPGMREVFIDGWRLGREALEREKLAMEMLRRDPPAVAAVYIPLHDGRATCDCVGGHRLVHEPGVGLDVREQCRTKPANGIEKCAGCCPHKEKAR